MLLLFNQINCSSFFLCCLCAIVKIHFIVLVFWLQTCIFGKDISQSSCTTWRISFHSCNKDTISSILYQRFLQTHSEEDGGDSRFLDIYVNVLSLHHDLYTQTYRYIFCSEFVFSMYIRHSEILDKFWKKYYGINEGKNWKLKLLCVNVHRWEYTCKCSCVRAGTHACVCLWRPEVNTGYLSRSFSNLAIWGSIAHWTWKSLIG